MRVNTRRNIVAVDAATAECLAALLGRTSICGVPVCARSPADRSASRGLVFGVDPSLTPADIMEGAESAVPIAGVERLQSSAVLIQFAGPVPPTCIHIWKLRLGVRACRPRPLQCGRCGRLDHATACCRGPARCARCGGSHLVDRCSAAAPRCTNCSGRHLVTDPSCPRWQQERRVATAMVRSEQPVSRVQVRATVRTEQTQLTMSYAAAAAAKQHRRPSGMAKTSGRGSPPAAPRSNDPPPAAPPAQSPDPLAQALLAAIQAILAALPGDSPARHTAAAALAAAQALTSTRHG